MAETGSDTPSGIGARLRAGREKTGLTQLQAAEKLHVDAKVVESLEAEQFEALGAPVFVRGHLKHYAELVGEKAAELLDLYAAASQPAPPDLTKLPKAAPESNPSRLAVPALVVLIGFVLLGVVWWVVKSVGGPQGAGPKRGPQPVAIAPELPRDPAVIDVTANEAVPSAGDAGAASGAAAANGAAGANGIAAANANSRAPANAQNSGATTAGGSRSRNTSASAAGPPSQSATSIARTTSVAAPGAAGRGAPSTSGTGSAAAGSAGAPASAGSAGAAAPAAGTAASTTGAPARSDKPMEVTLRFSADSWVEVYDANGQKLFYDVGTAASSRTVSGTPPFRVHVANAPGVSLDVNGKPATVPANAVKGDQAQFVINRSGRIVRARTQADGG
jgi:cytoskeleton protein RodZ